MTRTITPLMRLRLELDRTLRGRAFFARAIRGRLQPEEYIDLIKQLGGLVGLAGGDNDDLVELDALDRSRLSAEVEGIDLGLCATLDLLSAIGPPADWVPGDLTLDVCLTVSGTSWLHDAAYALREAYPEACTFLPELSRRGQLARTRLEARLHSRQADPPAVHAIAELARGVVLGLATHLDFNWRAPVHRFALPH